MTKINITEIINDEISNFDFLGNDEYLREQEIVDLLSNKELQKQFISDSLLNKINRINIIKIVDSNLISNWEEPNTNDANQILLDYSINMKYEYDSMKEPLLFNLNFNSDNIDIKNNNIDWKDINVTLFSMNGDEIDFKAFKNAPENIQILFIQHYTKDFVENEIPEINSKN